MAAINDLNTANRLLDVARQQIQQAFNAGVIDAEQRDQSLAALQPEPEGKEITVTLRVTGDTYQVRNNAQTVNTRVEEALRGAADAAGLSVVPGSVKVTALA